MNHQQILSTLLRNLASSKTTGNVPASCSSAATTNIKKPMATRLLNSNGPYLSTNSLGLVRLKQSITTTTTTTNNNDNNMTSNHHRLSTTPMGGEGLVHSLAIKTPTLNIPSNLIRKEDTMTPETTGPKWFNMPAPELTQEVKRELHILKSRGVLDPKRHYKRESKKSSSGGMPKFFQFGTVVAGAQDYYSGGGGSVKRKIGSNNNSSSSSSGGGLVDEVLADADKRAYFKRKFMDLQEKRRIKYGGFNKTKKKNGKKGGKSQN